MNDRDAAGLKNSVSSCETISNGLVTREAFNPKGHRTERWHRGTNGSESSAWWLYDEAGRLRSHEVSGAFPEISVYDYDALGRLLRVVTRAPEGERVAESYSYGDDGGSTLTIIPRRIRQNMQIAVDVGGMLHYSVDAIRIVSQQDRYGRLRWRALYDIDDRIIRKVSFHYDSAGHLLEEGEINFEGAISQDFRDTYRYNAEGRCVEKEVRRGGLSNRRSTMVYNDHGDLVEERIVELPGSIDLRDSVPPEYRPPTSWTVHYSYEYDEFWNWTARTETRASAAKPGQPPLITLRKFRYYESGIS